MSIVILQWFFVFIARISYSHKFSYTMACFSQTNLVIQWNVSAKRSDEHKRVDKSGASEEHLPKELIEGPLLMKLAVVIILYLISRFVVVVFLPLPL